MNAIILAAGLGSRFKEVTKKCHKALLPINNIPNIERTIQYLHEANIKEIHIVTGHLSHQFDYLKLNYNCNLIYNENYKKYNSIYSFYLASQYFNNSFVIDSDVVLMKNVFNITLKNSTYFVIQRPISENNEWIPIINETGLISDIEISNHYSPSLLGISYWNKESCILIKEELKNYLDDNILIQSKLYWDNIPIGIIKKLNMKTFELNQYDGFEMDNLKEYQFITSCLQG